MDRKAVAKDTLRILKQGYYEIEGGQVPIAALHGQSVKRSVLLAPDMALRTPDMEAQPARALTIQVENCATVTAILEWGRQQAGPVGVLNFASAKHPGGGFLNGAMAQEESLAASSGLYQTQCAHPAYYEANRACGTMRYTDYAIYSPHVVFFRDARFALLDKPATASVLTLPAVNFGQVLQKGEDVTLAKRAMKARMRRALSIFADRGDRALILGAYGCGVFRNDPEDVARWWQELLEEGFAGCFDSIFFAVMDGSKNQRCIRAFSQRFTGENGKAGAHAAQ